MEHYVGLDVSLKLTAICIVDRTGKIEREGVVASDPDAIATFIKSHAPHVVRIGFETGATSTWLWTELNKMGLPVICIDARYAKAALKMQLNKSDRNDAVGIARIMQCGWYKEVRVKDLDSHATKALLVSRALLVKIKRDIENQIRGLLKNLGLVIGRAKMNTFAARAAELTEERPELGRLSPILLSIFTFAQFPRPHYPSLLLSKRQQRLRQMPEISAERLWLLAHRHTRT
jgi:transposase